MSALCSVAARPALISIGELETKSRSASKVVSVSPSSTLKATSSVVKVVSLGAQLSLRDQLFEKNSELLPKLYFLFSFYLLKAEQIETCHAKKLMPKLFKTMENAARDEIMSANTVDKVRDLVLKMLFISKKEIEAVAKQETALIELRAQVLNCYSTIFDKYHIDIENNAALSDPESSTVHLLSFAELVTVTKAVFFKHLQGDEALFKTGIVVRYNKNTYYARIEAGKICILDYRRESLGEGAHGSVAKIWEIASASFVAVKSLFNPQNPRSMACFHREIKILKKIHADGIKPRLQPPLLASFILPHEKVYMIVMKFLPNGDLFDWLVKDPNISLTDRIACCKELLKAYKEKRETGHAHFDIKPENFLLDKDKKPVLCDWGGSVALPKRGEKPEIPLSFTTRCLTRQDFQLLMSWEDKENNPRKVNEAQAKDRADDKFEDEMRAVEERVDFFGLSQVLFQVLTKGDPFHPVRYRDYPNLEFPNFSNVSHQRIALNDMGYKNPELINTILKMLLEDHSKRPTIEQVEAVFAKV